MAPVGLTPGHEFLRDAARVCFEDRYGHPVMHVDKQLSPKLEWIPALRFTIHRYINVFVEPSESGAYPRILEIKHAEVYNFPEPIAVYCVCPENAITTSAGQKDLRRLKSHGFGLVTVDPLGTAEVLFSAIPLVQSISDAEFKLQLRDLPRGIKQRASEAFVEYRNSPVSGVKILSELIEGMIIKAGQDAVKQNHIQPGKISHATPAYVLDALYQNFADARAAIGGTRSYFRECRNLSHHWPKKKKDAYRKYADCRHQLLEGIRMARLFREAMKRVNLSGNVAPI